MQPEITYTTPQLSEMLDLDRRGRKQLRDMVANGHVNPRRDEQGYYLWSVEDVAKVIKLRAAFVVKFRRLAESMI